jgi:hypothetical protein
MKLFQISKLENPISLGMGVGTQPNFIDELPNNNGFTLPNKRSKVNFPFNGNCQ